MCIILIECLMPRDCKEWYELGVRKDGIYPVNPGNDDGFQVSTVSNPVNVRTELTYKINIMPWFVYRSIVI